MAGVVARFRANYSLRNPYFLESLVWPRVSILSFFFNAKENIFLNTRHQNAGILETTGNFFLSGYQYLFDGKTVVQINEKELDLVFIYSHSDSSFLRTTAAITTLIPAILLGAFVKGTAFLLSSNARARYRDTLDLFQGFRTRTVNYKEMEGFPSLFSDEKAPCQRLDYGLFSYQFLIKTDQRGANDPLVKALESGKTFRMTSRQQTEIAVLREIAHILNSKKIPWWVEAGTCLGAFRNEDIIPWDHDVDIAILRTEFITVYLALKALDNKKYEVQDWSPDVQRNSYLRVYLKETQTYIDIYVFDLDKQARTITYIGMTQYTNMPQWFKELDQSHVIPFSFDDILPLRPTKFAGIDVWVPNKVQEYLQDKYASKSGGRKGEICNIDPNIYWDPFKSEWSVIKDHPYPAELVTFGEKETSS